MNENFITWNIVNWITVFLMVMLGYAILSTVTSFAGAMMAKKEAGENA